MQVYKRFAVPGNMVITAVGKMNVQKTLDIINESFGLIPAMNVQAPVVSPQKPFDKVVEKTVRIPRAKAHIAIGFLGTTLADKDRCALEVVNNILSGQGGRLFLQLRDKESLAYTVTSFVRPGMDPGIFGFYMACDVTKLDRAVKGLFEQIRLIRDTKVSDETRNRAIDNLVGNHLIALQSSSSRAENSALNIIYGLGVDYDSEYINNLKKVTSEDVLNVAKKYLDPKKCGLVKILPSEE
jgi:zinc protease